MKLSTFFLCIFLYPYLGKVRVGSLQSSVEVSVGNPLSQLKIRGKAFQCFNCYIDGPFPFYFLKPLGPVWKRCSGAQDDFTDCSGGVCVEFMLYGSDISRYQILRSCAISPEICNTIEVGNSVHVGKCRTCLDNKCNNLYE